MADAPPVSGAAGGDIASAGLGREEDEDEDDESAASASVPQKFRWRWLLFLPPEPPLPPPPPSAAFVTPREVPPHAINFLSCPPDATPPSESSTKEDTPPTCARNVEMQQWFSG